MLSTIGQAIQHPWLNVTNRDSLAPSFIVDRTQGRSRLPAPDHHDLEDFFRRTPQFFRDRIDTKIAAGFFVPFHEDTLFNSEAFYKK